MELNIFKKKKSTIIDNILKQHEKVHQERNKLANMELEIIYSILPEEQRNIRKDVAMKKYEADHAEIPYLMFLTNLKYDLLKMGKTLGYIDDIIFELSEGNVISYHTHTQEEYKSLLDKAESYKNQTKKGQKVLTILMMIMGLVFIVSPLWNPPNFPNLWFSIGGYLIIGSAVAYGLLKWGK
jgi:hypothetical protein